MTSSDTAVDPETSTRSPWQPPTLDQGAAVAIGTDSAAQPAPQIDAETAHREAYDRGYAEGLAAGRARGESIVGEMSALLSAMTTPFAESEAAMLRELVNLVERTARVIIGRELETASGDIERVLNEAMEALEGVRSEVRLTLHPIDAALCRELGLVDAPEMELNEDPAVGRGGLKLQVGSTIVDATTEARLDAVMGALRERAGVPDPALEVPPDRPSDEHGDALT